MSTTRSMNFQAYLTDTYRIIKAEPIILILGGLLVQLLTILTMGILAGPFMGGYFLLIIHYLRENRKPKFNDLFSGLQQFANLLPYFLVLLTIFIGFMLLILPGFLFATWWIYVLPLMVDRKISFSEAMKISTQKVNETGFFMHFVFLLLIAVIPMLLLNFLSAMMPFLFVLKILLPPFQAGCLICLYVDQFNSKEPAVESETDNEPATETAVPSLPQGEDTSDQAIVIEADKPAQDTTPDDPSHVEETLSPSEEKEEGRAEEEKEERN